MAHEKGNQLMLYAVLDKNTQKHFFGIDVNNINVCDIKRHVETLFPNIAAEDWHWSTNKKGIRRLYFVQKDDAIQFSETFCR